MNIDKKVSVMCDNHKLDNFEHTVYILGEFIKNEEEQARRLGGAFLGRIIAYKEVLEKLTAGDSDEYKSPR